MLKKVSKSLKRKQGQIRQVKGACVLCKGMIKVVHMYELMISFTWAICDWWKSLQKQGLRDNEMNLIGVDYELFEVLFSVNLVNIKVEGF